MSDIIIIIIKWLCKVVYVALSGWKLCQNMWYHKTEEDNFPLTLYIDFHNF